MAAGSRSRGARSRWGGARAARIALLLALNAALLALLWHVAAPRLLARDRVPEGSAAADGSGEAAAGTPSGLGSSSAAAAPSPGAVTVAQSAIERTPAREPLAAFAPARRDRALEERIRAAIADAIAAADKGTQGRVARQNVRVGVHVRDTADGAELAALGADRAQRPASNLKLVTTGAALVLLGPDWRFRTSLVSAAPLEQGVLAGDLVVKGGGDPFYDPAGSGDVAHLLAPAIDALRAAGLTRVAGDLVLDEGRYLDPGPGPAWPAAGQHWSEYCALSGAFSANAGCFTARVVPGTVGAPARVEVRPAGHGLPDRIAVTTGAPRSKLDVRVSAIGGTLVVQGSLPANVAAWECRFAAPDPVALFGGALAHALRARGITLDGSVRRERVPPRPTTRLLAELWTPILSVLVPINAHSNNAVADQLYFALGDAQYGRGDRDGGRRATSLALQLLGVPDDGFEQVDGSGLSRENRVSARQITALVAGVLRRGGPAASAFLESMAAPRADGTLDARLKGLEDRLRAKTGFIGGTSALSGIVDTDDGRRLAFAILVEYPVHDGLNTSVWKPMQDRICRLLASQRR